MNDQSFDPIVMGHMPDGNPIYKMGGKVTPPRVVHASPEVYPEELKTKRGLEGRVALDVVIDAMGRVYMTMFTLRLHPQLDAAAANAVKDWTFNPATLNGNPAAVCINIEVNFRR